MHRVLGIIFKKIMGIFKTIKNLFVDAPKMEFKVGEGLNPAKTRVAERTIGKGMEIPKYKIKDRPVEVLDDELKDLGGVIFGEANNNIDEMRKIANVVINRSNQSYKPIFNELSKKSKNGGFEFNAYSGDQYNKYMTNNLDFVSRRKAELVNQILKEIKNGTLVDDTNGAVYFSHGKDGKLRTFKNLFENIQHAK